MRLIDADALIDDFDEQADSMVGLYKNSGCDCGPEDIDFNVVDITHTIQNAPTIYSKSTSYHTTTKSDYNRWGVTQGWECPRCGKILAPWMSTCTCDEKKATIDTCTHGSDIDNKHMIDVVTCGECKHKYIKGMNAYCPYRVSHVMASDFCSHGERSE